MSKLEEITKKAEKRRQKRTNRRKSGGMKWADLVKLHEKCAQHVWGWGTCGDGL